MWPIRLVVVVLPLEPVMPMVRPLRKGASSSTSPMTGTPRRRASSSGPRSAGAWGDRTINSAPSKTAGVCWAKGMWSSRTPGSASSGLRSVARTRAPSRASNAAEATPDFFIPTTSASMPLRFISVSSEFQGSEREQGQHQAGDPEARDDFRFGPAQRFEVMVDGRHFENAFAVAQLIAAHLKDDGNGFQNEDAADEEQQDFLLDEHGNHGHGAAEAQRTDVAHEDFGGMRVVPQEADASPGHGAAEHGEFAGARIARQLQVLGELRVASGIGEDGEGAGGDHHETDGEPIESVGEVDGVGAEDHHQRHEDAEGGDAKDVGPRVGHQLRHQHRWFEALEERDVHRGAEIAPGAHEEQGGGETEAHDELVDQLALAADSEIAPIGVFGVVVQKTDPAEGEQGEDGNPHVGVAQVGPEQRGDNDGDDDEDAAHGGGAGFLLVRFGAFLPDELADLELAKLVDEPWTQRDAQEERGERGEGGARSSVSEDAERADALVQ